MAEAHFRRTVAHNLAPLLRCLIVFMLSALLQVLWRSQCAAIHVAALAVGIVPLLGHALAFTALGWRKAITQREAWVLAGVSFTGAGLLRRNKKCTAPVCQQGPGAWAALAVFLKL